MLRNSILPICQVVKLHSVNLESTQSVSKAYRIQSKIYAFNAHRKLVFTPKYGFFKDEVKVDYKKNYYEVLQIHESATLAQIKKSFYKLAKQSHPDTSKGDEELFKSINEAYNVLSHQQRRKIYDINRVRNAQNPNDAKAQAQRRSTHSQQNSQEDYQASQDYEQRKQQAYYHYTRGQWSQFRAGYKYHVSPQSEYFSNITNNVSTEKLYQTMKNKRNTRSEQDEAFLSQMEQYYAYLEKVRQKKQKDIEDYQVKLAEMEKKLYEQKKLRFRKTLIGRGFTKVQNVFAKVSDLFGRLLKRESKASGDSK